MEELSELPPVAPLCKSCAKPKEMELAYSQKESSLNRPYYKCHACNDFL